MKSQAVKRQANRHGRFENIFEDRLFLYVDILGFSNLIKNTEKVDRLFCIIDSCQFHKDSNYRCLVFSDTILVYNTNVCLGDGYKSIEVMFLLELAQDLFLRLSGEDVFFRAIITEGPFKVKKLTNIQAFYGEALVEAHNDEKAINCIGLFLDPSLRRLNKHFQTKIYSSEYDFVYLSPMVSRFESPKNLSEPIKSKTITTYPIRPEAITDFGGENQLYKELVTIIQIFKNIKKSKDERVKGKYQNAWRMYQCAYPELTEIIARRSFDLNMISKISWERCRIDRMEEMKSFPFSDDIILP